MWPFKKKKEPDSLAENLVSEIEILARNAGDWKVPGYSTHPALEHRSAVSINKYGDVRMAGQHISVSSEQRDRMAHCYNEMLIAKALSACVNHD